MVSRYLSDHQTKPNQTAIIIHSLPFEFKLSRDLSFGLVLVGMGVKAVTSTNRKQNAGITRVQPQCLFNNISLTLS